MSKNRTFVQAFLKIFCGHCIFSTTTSMGRAQEQTKGATFFKNISQWLEQENAKI